jgi:hypothetical protein
VNQVNTHPHQGQPIHLPDDRLAGDPTLIPPAPLSAERLVERYEYLTSRAAELADSETGEVPAELAAELARLEEELPYKLDACCLVMERLEGRCKAYGAEAGHYKDIAKSYAAKQESLERNIERLRDKIKLLCATSPDESMQGDRYKAALRKGKIVAVPVEDNPPVPQEAKRIVESVDKTKLAELARDGKAPGWMVKPSVSLRISRT